MIEEIKKKEQMMKDCNRLIVEVLQDVLLWGDKELAVVVLQLRLFSWVGYVGIVLHNFIFSFKI